LGIDVIKYPLLSINHDGNCGVLAIDGYILPKSIAIDIAKWLLTTTCGKEDLLSRNFLVDEEVPNGSTTVKTGKNWKVISDVCNLSFDRKIVVWSFRHYQVVAEEFSYLNYFRLDHRSTLRSHMSHQRSVGWVALKQNPTSLRQQPRNVGFHSSTKPTI
jgi:hypothetical protein